MNTTRKDKRTLQAQGIEMTPESRSKYITVTIGKESARILYKELWSMLYVLGDAKYQEQMMPVRKEERMVFSRKLRIRTNKDLKEGEEIVVWAEFDVAKDVAEAIVRKEGGILSEQEKEISTGIPASPIISGSTLKLLPDA